MAESATRVCDLCCHEASEWVVGECDHPICLRCTGKLRVLCEQIDCPVCRLKLEMVIVCKDVRPFADMARSRMPGDRTLGIYFKTPELQTTFENLKANTCTICSPNTVFRTFKQLRQHMLKSHDLRYCEICLSSLKLFPQEFKTYSFALLTKHRKDGDIDDKSHKGHPMCKFCDERFLDNDALHTHLRTDHFWCHICEVDGKQDYYKNYILLRKHFKEGHFLCEEGACREEKLTTVFRSKIDLQAHRAALHTKGLSKAEVKQMRHVELGFSYGGGRSEGPRIRTGGHSRTGRPSELREQEDFEMATALSVSTKPSRDTKKHSSHQLPSPLPQRKSSQSPTEDVPKPPPGLAPVEKAVTASKKRPNKPKSHQKHSPDENQSPIGLKPKPIEQPSVFEDKMTSSGFDPYSDSCKKAKFGGVAPAKPPGFERISTPVKKKQDDWPEITSDTTIPKQSESELTGLHAPSFIYAGPSAAWNAPKEEEKHPILHIAPVKKYSKEDISFRGREAFPPMPSNGHPSPKVSRQKVESKIVGKIQLILGNDKTRFTQFKTLSGWYRNSEISVEEYTRQCADLFGPNWQEIGPQVAEVIPVESKKQELMSYFHPKTPRFSKPPKSKKKSKQPAVWGMGTPATTGNRHKQSVLNESEYPSLATASTMPAAKMNSGTDAWNTIVRI